MTTLRGKPIKIGRKVVNHGRYVTCKLADVAMPRSLFREILRRIDEGRRRPAPASAERIGSETKATREGCLNGGPDNIVGGSTTGAALSTECQTNPANPPPECGMSWPGND